MLLPVPPSQAVILCATSPCGASRSISLSTHKGRVADGENSTIEAHKRRTNRALLGDVRHGLALQRTRPISSGRALAMLDDTRRNELRMFCMQEVRGSNPRSSTRNGGPK